MLSPNTRLFNRPADTNQRMYESMLFSSQYPSTAVLYASMPSVDDLNYDGWSKIPKKFNNCSFAFLLDKANICVLTIADQSTSVKIQEHSHTHCFIFIESKTIEQIEYEKWAKQERLWTEYFGTSWLIELHK